MVENKEYTIGNKLEHLVENPKFLTISDLSVGYRKQPILSSLNLSAAECELVALVGRNGIGKSTLMRTIARLQPAISGRIHIGGKSLADYSRSELACLLSIVSTESVGVSHMTVKQLVALGRFPYTNWIGRLTGADVAAVEEAIQLVGITHLVDKNMHEISDGERQRAMIARTLAQDTNMILLDEPTAFLDMPNKYELIRLLHRLTRKKRKTIIFSTHDLNIAMQEADKLWLMVDDRVYEGAPEDLILSGQLVRIFEGSKLQFDDNKGEFNIKRSDARSIKLFGHGKNLFWTRKALERMGYAIDNQDSNFSDIHVIVSDTQPVFWTVTHQGTSQRFDSIYNLSQNLLINNYL